MPERRLPAIPYGRHQVTIDSTVGAFFPSQDALSATVLGVMLRADEIRMCQGRISELRPFPTKRRFRRGDSLWDASLERMMMIRFSLIAAFDLAKHVKALNGDDRFRRALGQVPEDAALFRDGYADLVKTIKKWDTGLRHKLFAHLDTAPGEPLPLVLAQHQGDPASIHLGHLRGDFAFPVVHLLVMRAMTDEPEWGMGVRARLALMDRVNAAAFKLLWPCIAAFHRLTGCFLPDHLRLRPQDQGEHVRSAPGQSRPRTKHVRKARRATASR